MKKEAFLYHQLLDKSKNVFSGFCAYRLRNTCLLASLILLKGTVNLNRLKPHAGAILGNTDSQTESHYKRLTRYFNDAFNQRFLWKWLLAHVVTQLISKLDGRCGGRYLIMDGTSWELGSVKYHFLTLSVVFHGAGIPICWVELGKKGHSNLHERKALIKMAALFYDLKGMKLLADREYKGKQWFAWLDSLGIEFHIRACSGDYKTAVVGKMAYSHLCKKAKKGRKVETLLDIEGKLYRLLATADPKDDSGLLLIVTNRQTGKAAKLMDIYRMRWKIETMFFHLKSNGFDLEGIGLTNPKKVRLMMALVVFCYVLCVCHGVKDLKKARRQKQAQGGYLYESIFRRGYGAIAPYFTEIVLLLELVIKAMGGNKAILKRTE